MAEDIGSLVVRIKADITNFESATKQINNKVNGISSMLKGFAGIVAAAFAVKAVVGFGKSMIMAASDAAEMQSKFDTVFANMSAEAEDWAATFRSKVGGSKVEIKTMLAATQDLLTGFGATTEQAFDFSTKIQGLGTDLASFSNIQGGATEAVERLRKGLLGETENLKALGIVINENTMNQELASRGDKRKIKDLSELEKIELRYAIAVKQSKNAIGDAEKTSGGFANQVRNLKGQLHDLVAALGEKLLPIAVKVITWINAQIPKVQAVFERVISGIVSLINYISGFVSGFISKISSGYNRIFRTVSSTSAKVVGVVKGQHEEEKKAALESVNKQISDAQKLRAAKISEAQKGAAGVGKSNEDESKSLKKKFEERIDALRKSFDEQKKAATKHYNNVLKEAEKAADKEVKIARDASDEKIKQYDKEYMAKLKAIDEDTYNQVKALRDQIDGINQLTDDEEKALEEREHNNKVAELRNKIASAKTAGDRAELQNDLNELIANREHKLLLERRKDQIEALKAEIDRVKNNAEEKKDLLKEEYDAKKEAEKKNLELIVERLKEEKDLTTERIREEREQNLEMLEERRDVALKYLEEEKENALESIKAQKEALSGIGGGGAFPDIELPENDAIADLLKQKEEIEEYYDGLTEETNGFSSGILGIFQSTFRGIGETIRPALDDASARFEKLYKKVAPSFIKVFESMENNVLPAWGAAIDTLTTGVLPPLIDLLVSIYETVMPPLAEVFEFIYADIIPKFAEAFKVMAPYVVTIFKGLVDSVKALLDSLKQAFNTAWPVIKFIVSTAVDLILGILQGLMRTLSGVIEFIAGVFTGDWRRAWNGIKDIFGGIWDAIKNTLKVAINVIIDGINWLIEKINKIPGINIPLVANIEVNTKETGTVETKSVGTTTGFRATNTSALRGYATGTDFFRGGLAMVGEAGRELVNLPRGSQIIPNKQTEQLLGQMQGDNISNISNEGMFKGAVFNVRSDSDIKALAIELFNLQQARARGRGIPATA